MFDSTYLILLHFENNQANKKKIKDDMIQNKITYRNNPLHNGCHPVTKRILNDTDNVIVDNSIITNNSKKPRK